MIQFREKLFVGPAMALVGGPIGLGVMGVGTGVSIAQGHKANKQQEQSTK